MLDTTIKKEIREAVEDAFSAGVKDKRFVDVSRIPLICQAITVIEARLTSIEGNVTWGVRIIIGAILAALLTLIFK